MLFTDHDDVTKWKHFPRCWPFVWGIHRSSVNSPDKGQWRGVFYVFFDLHLNKRLSKQSWGWWFEMPSRSLGCHCNCLPEMYSLPFICSRATMGLILYKSFISYIANTCDTTDHEIQCLYSLSDKTYYRQISWSLDDARLDVKLLYRSEIWRASRQRCCLVACQISERFGKSKFESRRFEISQDLVVKRITT